MLVIQVFFGLGEAGRVSHRHAFALPLDAPHRTRPGAGRHARRFTPGRRAHAADSRGLHVSLGLHWTGVIPLYGWRAAFWLFGVVGVIWSIAWFLYYRDTPEEHASVNPAERALIGGGRKRSAAAVPWKTILSHGNIWVLAAMYFCYNFNLNVYQDWFPTYLNDAHHIAIAKMGRVRISAFICRHARRFGGRLVFGSRLEIDR